MCNLYPWFWNQGFELNNKETFFACRNAWTFFLFFLMPKMFCCSSMYTHSIYTDEEAIIKDAVTHFSEYKVFATVYPDCNSSWSREMRWRETRTFLCRQNIKARHSRHTPTTTATTTHKDIEREKHLRNRCRCIFMPEGHLNKRLNRFLQEELEG